jgi:hypothetical protein
MLKTAKEVEAKIREGAPGRWAVGEGAYLQVAKVGKRVTASWLLRYQRDGRGRHMGLGPVGLLSLSEARDRARDARRLLLDGIDPLEAKAAKRRQASLAAARGVTFEHCAGRYIKSHAAGWRNPKHKAQWAATLETYVYHRSSTPRVSPKPLPSPTSWTMPPER